MFRTIIALAFSLLFSNSARAEEGVHLRKSLQCSNATGTLTYTEKNMVSGAPVMDGMLISEKVWKYGVAVEGNFIYRFVLLKLRDYMGTRSERSSTLKATFLETTEIFDNLIGKRIFSQKIKLNPGSGGWVLTQASVTENFICSEIYATEVPY